MCEACTILTCALRGVSETGARSLPCPAAERYPVVYLHVCGEACQRLAPGASHAQQQSVAQWFTYMCVARRVRDWRPDPPMPSSRALPSGLLTCVWRGVSETGARTLPCPAAERYPVVYLHVCGEACQRLAPGPSHAQQQGVTQWFTYMCVARRVRDCGNV